MHSKHLRTWLLVGLVAGCGAPAAEPNNESTAETQGGERTDPREDALAITGLRGTLSQSEIQGALEPRMMKFSRCVQQRASSVEWLSGKVELTFHIALDGSVASVFPSASSMGDRETERCLLEVAKNVRFPAPHGGEADFSWPLEVPLDSDVREPVVWDPAQFNEVLLANAETALTTCIGSFAITAYIDPDGHVVAAGASTPNLNDAEKLDCISAAIKAWTFPSPGSYAAKVSFNLR